MKFQCTNCGADVPIEERSEFVQCAYCNAALYIDAAETVKHVYLEFALEENECLMYLKKQLSRLEIEEDITIGKIEKTYYPYWCFETNAIPRKMVCATFIEAEELSQRVPPPQPFKMCTKESVEKSLFRESEKHLEQARVEFLGDAKREAPSDLKVSLVETPYFVVEYTCLGATFGCLIDGVLGKAYSSEWPPTTQGKKDRILGAIAIITASVFLLEAAFLPSLWITFVVYAITGTVAYHGTLQVFKRMGW